jgi:HSP20 family protein
MEAMQSEMNRLFSRFGGFSTDHLAQSHAQNGQNPDNSSNNQWMLSVDVIETPDALKLKAALPGVEEKDINIEVNDNLLTISAQRRHDEQVEADSYQWIEQQYGTFSRSLTLPRYADAEKIEATYTNGLLELTIPKKESSKPRRIELQTSSPQSRTLEATSPSPAENRQLQNSAATG